MGLLLPLLTAHLACGVTETPRGEWGASLDRRQRRELTRQLNVAWGHAPAPCRCRPYMWEPAQPVLWGRRPRRLLLRQAPRWQRSKARWSGRPACGVGFGEAKNPGPPAPGTPVGGKRDYGPRRRARSPSMDIDVGAPPGRVHCPVPGCPCADAARSPGWATVPSMRHHIHSHLAGILEGGVPADWIQARGRTRCHVCGLSVSMRHAVHPTCRPAARDAVEQVRAPRAADDSLLPNFEDIQNGRTRTLRHVPAGSSAPLLLWPTTIMSAWRELLMLPQSVLGTPPRGGRRHRKASAVYTQDRLQRWCQGKRQTLWDDRHIPRQEPSRKLSAEQRQELAVSLAREGFERKACNALLAEGLCPDSPATAAALRELHPTQPSPAVARDTLPLALEVMPDIVGKALRSFLADTAPGPSGLRIQHLREAGYFWPLSCR